MPAISVFKEDGTLNMSAMKYVEDNDEVFKNSLGRIPCFRKPFNEFPEEYRVRLKNNYRTSVSSSKYLDQLKYKKNIWLESSKEDPKAIIVDTNGTEHLLGDFTVFDEATNRRLDDRDKPLLRFTRKKGILDESGLEYSFKETDELINIRKDISLANKPVKFCTTTDNLMTSEADCYYYMAIVEKNVMYFCNKNTDNLKIVSEQEQFKDIKVRLVTRADRDGNLATFEQFCEATLLKSTDHVQLEKEYVHHQEEIFKKLEERLELLKEFMRYYFNLFKLRQTHAAKDLGSEEVRIIAAQMSVYLGRVAEVYDSEMSLDDIKAFQSKLDKDRMHELKRYYELRGQLAKDLDPEVQLKAERAAERKKLGKTIKKKCQYSSTTVKDAFNALHEYLHKHYNKPTYDVNRHHHLKLQCVSAVDLYLVDSQARGVTVFLSDLSPEDSSYIKGIMKHLGMVVPGQTEAKVKKIDLTEDTEECKDSGEDFKKAARKYRASIDEGSLTRSPIRPLPEEQAVKLIGEVKIDGDNEEDIDMETDPFDEKPSKKPTTCNESIQLHYENVQLGRYEDLDQSRSDLEQSLQKKQSIAGQRLSHSFGTSEIRRKESNIEPNSRLSSSLASGEIRRKDTGDGKLAEMEKAIEEKVNLFTENPRIFTAQDLEYIEKTDKDLFNTLMTDLYYWKLYTEHKKTCSS